MTGAAAAARAVPWARGTAGVAVFLLLAEAAGRLGIISRSALPLTSAVLARAVLLAGNTRFLADFGATVEAWAVGMAITVAAGVPLGVLLGSLPGVRVATRAIVEFLRPIPSVALILLVSLLLGPGLRMSVTLIVYGAIWPVLYNTIAGIDDVDPLAKETNLAFGFSRLATIRMVSLPSAAPFIATGIRLASVGRDHPRHRGRLHHRPDQRPGHRRVHRPGEHRRERPHRHPGGDGLGGHPRPRPRPDADGRAAPAAALAPRAPRTDG